MDHFQANQNTFYANQSAIQANQSGSLQVFVQGSMLQPVGSSMQLDLIQWRLTFNIRSPV